MDFTFLPTGVYVLCSMQGSAWVNTDVPNSPLAFHAVQEVLWAPSFTAFIMLGQQLILLRL